MDIQSVQEELVRTIELANLWKVRAKAALELARYLNSIHRYDGPFMYDDDLKEEVEKRANVLLKRMRQESAELVTQ